ncbi:hypothetical protein ABE042_04685 [Viridibacillus arvi]|uniref:hypothetical protein n=1 Tax=Viridibacillus arvi TaxID=263475 RepID=UPI003D2682E4
MLAPVDKKFRSVIIYLYGREIDIETNVDILAAEENGEKYVDLEDGRRIDLTSIERIITAEN